MYKKKTSNPKMSVKKCSKCGKTMTKSHKCNK